MNSQNKLYFILFTLTAIFPGAILTSTVKADEVTSQFNLPEVDSVESWRKGKCCGPNALYCMLRLNNIDVNLHQVLNEAPPGKQGVTLAELESASNKLGLKTIVVQVEDIEKIANLPFPMVAHLSVSRGGHYVVLLGIDDASGDVVIGDGVTCEVYRQSLAKFSQSWSGYLLIHEKETFLWWFAFLISGFCCLFLISLLRKKSFSLIDYFKRAT